MGLSLRAREERHASALLIRESFKRTWQGADLSPCWCSLSPKWLLLSQPGAAGQEELVAFVDNAGGSLWMAAGTKQALHILRLSTSEYVIPDIFTRGSWLEG